MSKTVDFARQHAGHDAYVAELGEYQLRDLEDAICVRRLALMAARLERAGFSIRTGFGADDAPMTAILVYDPASSYGVPAEWATAAEARHLLDFAANLEPAEAFRRWRETVEPVDGEGGGPSVRELNDKATLRRERQQAREDYANGKIDQAALRDAHTPRR